MDTSADQEFVTTVITVEEQMLGWLAVINQTNEAHGQVPAYDQLTGLFDFFAQWTVLPFSRQAAEVFQTLRRQKIRIGTMDLKIAAIALTYDALVLSANLRDFGKVEHLRVESWLA
jgi:tRNA(fMet)-specific endonuclease VapC